MATHTFYFFKGGIMKRAVNLILFSLLIGLALQGCSALRSRPYLEVPGVYSGGILVTEYRAGVIQTYDATRSALDDFNMKITNSEKDATGGMIQATQTDGTQVDISLRAKGADTTAEIRVGPEGNEEQSRAISRRIAARL
jgi:hypothetical protein